MYMSWHILTYTQIPEALQEMSDLFHSRAEVCDETLRNFATRQRVPPHLPGLRLIHHFQLHSKRSKESWLEMHVNVHAKPLPFNRSTYRCQTHHTPRDDRLALASTSLFSPLYMLKVWSERSIVVTYIGPVCLMVCVPE